MENYDMAFSLDVYCNLIGEHNNAHEIKGTWVRGFPLSKVISLLSY